MHELITGYNWDLLPNAKLDKEVTDLTAYPGFCSILNGSLSVSSFRPTNTTSFCIPTLTDDELVKPFDDGFFSDGI